MRPERLDPGRGEALRTAGCRLLRDRLREAGLLRARAPSPRALLAARVEHGLPWIRGGRSAHGCDSTRDLIRRFHHSGFDLGRLLEHKTEPITAVLPAREVADTIGQIVERLRSLDPLIDQIVVVDANSRDGTAASRLAPAPRCTRVGLLPSSAGAGQGRRHVARPRRGARRPGRVPRLGHTRLPAALRDRHARAAPLHPGAAVREGFFRRPYLRPDGQALPADGGRGDQELAARPLLSAFYPGLAGFVQPLAGEVAARRELFDRIRSPPATPSRRRCSSTSGRARRHRGHGAGRPRRAAQPAPAAHAARPMAYAVLRVILERPARGRCSTTTPPLQTADGGWCRSSSWSGRRMQRSALGA